MPKQRAIGLYLLALLGSLLSLQGLPPLLLLVPALLFEAGRKLRPWARLLAALLWGMLFSAIFHRWSLHYGPWPWMGLIVARGLPWLLFPIPALFCEWRKLEGKAWELMCGTLGYTFVCCLLLLGPTGNDWETPMAALAPWPWALSSLPWLGLTGSAAFLALVSMALCSGHRKFSGLGLGLLLSWAGGSWLLAGSQDAPSLPSQLRVALIQTGWSQEQKWDKESVALAKERLLLLTEEGADSGAQLVIWPETAWPIRGMRQRFSDTRAIGRLARRQEVQVLASSIEETEKGTWLNSVSQVLPSGKFGQEYQKLRLAPFAEYIPLPNSLAEPLRRFSPFDGISRFEAGQESVLFQTGDSHYGVLVCFESQVPWPAAQLAEEVDFLVVVTNDAPLVDEWPKECHFRSAVLRAAQYRKPILQASNNGVSGVIDGAGRVLQRSAPGFSGAKVYVYP